jgi:hypothetical protein
MKMGSQRPRSVVKSDWQASAFHELKHAVAAAASYLMVPIAMSALLRAISAWHHAPKADWHDDKASAGTFGMHANTELHRSAVHCAQNASPGSTEASGPASATPEPPEVTLPELGELEPVETPLAINELPLAPIEPLDAGLEAAVQSTQRAIHAPRKAPTEAKRLCMEKDPRMCGEDRATRAAASDFARGVSMAWPIHWVIVASGRSPNATRHQEDRGQTNTCSLPSRPAWMQAVRLATPALE